MFTAADVLVVVLARKSDDKRLAEFSPRLGKTRCARYVSRILHREITAQDEEQEAKEGEQGIRGKHFSFAFYLLVIRGVLGYQIRLRSR